MRHRKKVEEPGGKTAAGKDGNGPGRAERNGGKKHRAAGLPPGENYEEQTDPNVRQLLTEVSATTAKQLVDDFYGIKFDKRIFEERLVLEELICGQLGRCTLFLVQFFIFLSMLSYSYDAPGLLPVHTAIMNSLTIKDQFGNPVTPGDVKNVEMLQDYLAGLSPSWRDFSPGSSTYVQDPLARNFLGNPAQFPPQQSIAVSDAPQLADEFTFAVWVNTQARFDTIIQKTQSARNTTCWALGLETLRYGKHEAPDEIVVVNPLASSMYAAFADAAEAWKTSAIRSQFSNGDWNHFAVMVGQGNVIFAHNGQMQRPVSLPRQITDCSDGQLHLGSATIAGQLMDLKYIPRLLSEVELDFLRQSGKLLDDLLAGSGLLTPAEAPMTALQRSVDELAAQTTKQTQDSQARSTLLVRQLEGRLRAEENKETSARRLTAEADYATVLGAARTGVPQGRTPDATAAGLLRNLEAAFGAEATPALVQQGTAVRRGGAALSALSLLGHVAAGAAAREAFAERDGWFLEDGAESRRLGKAVCAEKPGCDETIMLAALRYADFTANTTGAGSAEATAARRLANCVFESPGAHLRITYDLLYSGDAQALLPPDGSCAAAQQQASQAGLLSVQAVLRQAFTTEESALCNQEFFGNGCPNTCGLCKLQFAPTTTAVVDDLQSCADSGNYTDWLSEKCAWYQENDPSCLVFADDSTKASCALTCQTCEYAAKTFELFDVDSNGLWDTDEANLFQRASAVKGVTPRRQWTTFLLIVCQSLAGLHVWEDGLAQNVSADVAAQVEACLAKCLSGIPREILLNHKVRFEFFLTQWASKLVTQLSKPAVYVFSNASTIARTFPTPEILVDAQILALQNESRYPAFRECRTHADCAGQIVYACGDVWSVKNQLCQRSTQVPLYCATTCLTGGCGTSGDVRPGVVGSFCQPCDGCFRRNASAAPPLAEPCPARCTGFAVDDNGTIAGPVNVTPSDRDLKGVRVDSRPGSFTLSAWVKTFDAQSVFRKTVRMPGLDSRWSGYDTDSGDLLCWELTTAGLTFRSHWSDKNVTTVANPLKALLSDDDWHLLVLRKNSVDMVQSDGSTVRVEELTFFVDDQQGPAETDPFGDAFHSVKAYGFPDCGGQMLTQAEAVADFYQGPQINTSLPYWVVANQDILPIGAAPVAATALSFPSAQLPANASIRDARLQICAAIPWVKWLADRFPCSYDFPKTWRIKIAGLLPNPSGVSGPDANDFCTIANQAGKVATRGSPFGRTATQVEWVVDVAGWMGRGVYMQDRSTTTDDSQPADCLVGTPDVSSIIEELVSFGADKFTFVIAKWDQPWDACAYTSPWYGEDFQPTYDLLYTQLQQGYSPCALLAFIGTTVANTFPLWAVPVNESSQTGAKLAKLVVQYCLNEECISSAFLGAGRDALQGVPQHWYRDQQHADGTRRMQASSHPAERRLQASVDNSTGTQCGDFGSCLQIGRLLGPGLSPEGVLYKATFVTRAMALSEVQAQYYEGVSQLQAVSAPVKPVAQRSQSVDVQAYLKEVVSIIPPLIFQSRAPVVNCSAQIPGLAESVTKYFQNQVGKCWTTYACNFPQDDNVVHTQSGFRCIDRSNRVWSEEKHFNTSAIDIQGQPFYPEFLDLLTVPSIYRGAVLSTSDWVDFQTTVVQVLNVFISPSLRSGTVLSVMWEYDGPGRLKSTTTLYSYVRMTAQDQGTWMVLVGMVFGLSLLDILVLFMRTILRCVRRKRIFQKLTGASRAQRFEIRKHRPVITKIDIIDVAFRCLVISFCVTHIALYYQGDSSLGTFEGPIKQILDLPWRDPNLGTKQKVNEFVRLVLDFQGKLESESFHRLEAEGLVLLFFVRVIIYMRVHPRVAILYTTVIVMLEDLFHFAIIFLLIFMTMAWLSSWSFGDKLRQFGSLQDAMYMQFRMLIGDWNLPDGGFTAVFGIYCVLYYFLVFSLLLNFFLAIVIDSYAEVQDQVSGCVVENSLLWDIYCTFLYPVLAVIYGWPQREMLLTEMMGADVDADNINDEEEEGIFITPDLLNRLGVIRGRTRAAVRLFRYYRKVCPRLILGSKEHHVALEHQKEFRHQLAVDKIRASLVAERVPEGVTPPGRCHNAPPEDSPRLVVPAVHYERHGLRIRSSEDVKANSDALRHALRQANAHADAWRREMSRVEAILNPEESDAGFYHSTSGMDTWPNSPAEGIRREVSFTVHAAPPTQRPPPPLSRIGPLDRELYLDAEEEEEVEDTKVQQSLTTPNGTSNPNLSDGPSEGPSIVAEPDEEHHFRPGKQVSMLGASGGRGLTQRKLSVPASDVSL